MKEKYTQNPTAHTNIPLITPVLFLIFNRPEATEQVFSAIKKAQPTLLYIAADGPRSDYSNEADNCELARSIATNVDWDCEVKTLFRDQNLGCRLAVSQAIDWFFEQEPEGIILEDDCVPEDNFFRFCQELLELYRNENEVGAICGFYSNEQVYKPENSYFFSRYLRVWGWAGWRRTFEGYDSNINLLIENKNTWQSDIFDHADVLIKKYFQQMFDQVANGQVDTWDTQLQYLLWQKKQWVATSSNNLIKNIGWAEGTHAQKKDHNHDLPTGEIKFPLDHPENFERDIKADQIIEQKSYRITKLSYVKSCLKKLIQ